MSNGALAGRLATQAPVAAASLLGVPAVGPFLGAVAFGAQIGIQELDRRSGPVTGRVSFQVARDPATGRKALFITDEITGEVFTPKEYKARQDARKAELEGFKLAHGGVGPQGVLKAERLAQIGLPVPTRLARGVLGLPPITAKKKSNE